MLQELNIKKTEIDFGLDSIVVRKFTNGVLGGITLDLTGYEDSTVLAGQVVITNGEVYRPMPVSGDTYRVLPIGFRYIGVIYRSSKAYQGVSVMTRGAVNKFRMPYNFEQIKEEFCEQCPFIIMASDADEMSEYERLEASDGVILTSDGREIVFRTINGGENTEGV